MSKLTDIIRREVKDLVSKQGGLMVTPAVVTAVQEDHLRADVKLLGNGAEIKGMLNKSPGKLTVGQTVTVAYDTLPSSGVILIANGETDPLSEGGGWEVETAAIFDNSNFDDFVIDAEEMAEISSQTKLYYGATSRFIIVQGMLCYYGAWGTSTQSAPTVLPPTLNGSEEAFQAILDNWDCYSHCFGDMDNPSGSLMIYDTNRKIIYASAALITNRATMRYQNGVESVNQSLRTFGSSWSWTPSEYPTTLKFYDDLTPEEKATVIPGNHWSGSTSSHNAYHNGSTYLPNLVAKYALIPIVTAISATTHYDRYPTPYGYVTLNGFMIIADDEWAPGLDSTSQIAGTRYGNPAVPFKSQAELDFALGLTKRSEPSET